MAMTWMRLSFLLSDAHLGAMASVLWDTFLTIHDLRFSQDGTDLTEMSWFCEQVYRQKDGISVIPQRLMDVDSERV